jgi:predicted porin
MMKTRHLAIALAALAASGAASAQTESTNVTLYGILDAYVQSARGAQTLHRLQSGGLSGSRFGIRGSEDLGGGLRGIFTLESGINLDDGTSGQGAFWGRQAFVGLDSRFGKLTLGRQYGSIYTLASEFSQFTNGPIGASTAVIGGFGGYEPVRGNGADGTATGNGGPSRINNSVKYETPSLAGLRAGAVVGLGEVAGGTSDTRVADVYGRYSNGPLDLMLSFVDDKVEASGLEVRTLSAAGAYRIGSYRLNAGIIDVDDRVTAAAEGQGWWVGGDYRLGRNQFKLQYLVSKAKGADEGRTQALGLGYQFDLSKRTSLYSTLTRFRNEGATYGNRWASSMPEVLTTAADRHVTEVVAGIRHVF